MQVGLPTIQVISIRPKDIMGVNKQKVYPKRNTCTSPPTPPTYLYYLHKSPPTPKVDNKPYFVQRGLLNKAGLTGSNSRRQFYRCLLFFSFPFFHFLFFPWTFVDEDSKMKPCPSFGVVNVSESVGVVLTHLTF